LILPYCTQSHRSLLLLLVPHIYTEAPSTNATHPPSTRNTIDEQKQNYGSSSSGVSRDIGRHNPVSKSTTAPSLPELNAGQTLSEGIDEALKNVGTGTGTGGVHQSVTVKVGDEDEVDAHELAAGKQP
jgi:hypothetical protein